MEPDLVLANAQRAADAVAEQIQHAINKLSRFWSNQTPAPDAKPGEYHEAAAELTALVVHVDREHIRCGRLALDGLRGLGRYIDRHPTHKGRPKKCPDPDSLPSLADIGISDRRIAHRARVLWAIPQRVYDEYLKDPDEPKAFPRKRRERPTENGLIAFAKELSAREREVGKIAEAVEERLKGRRPVKAPQAMRAAPPVSTSEREKPKKAETVLAMLLHPGSSDGERTNAAAAIQRLDPDFEKRIVQLWRKPSDAKPTVPTFLGTDTALKRIAERDRIITEQKRQIHRLQKELREAKLETEIARRENEQLRDRLAAMKEPAKTSASPPPKARANETSMAQASA